MGKHRKHAKLELRNTGNYAPQEISILGAKCSIIAYLVNNIAKKHQKTSKFAYLDASHNSDIQSSVLDTFTFNASGNLEVNSESLLNKFNARIHFSEYDFLFINGNHYQGEQQILILDNEKEPSVLKRLDQLTNIQFVIKRNSDSHYFDFLVEAYPTIKNLHCYQLSEIDKISNHIEKLMQQAIAPVQGLVLAGGKSIRMGTDKGTLDFYGKNQRDIAIELLEKQNLKTFLSIREDQEINIENKITDKFVGLGPFGAICSAFQENPNTAWLVLATDLPFVNSETIKLLLKHRNPSKAATTIKGKNKQFPEPLITIWEPKSYKLLLNYLSQGYSCPRKVLINSDVEIVEIDDKYIRNINTPEEFEAAHKEINE
jgi:molybdopterin-guanine dinucleotide biosynthesis protein A